MQTEFLAIPRAILPQSPIATRNRVTTTFAMLEFLNNGDSNYAKQRWSAYGMRDISPLWARRAIVPTFSRQPDIIARWSEFQAQMRGVRADWYYVSGHHSARFNSMNREFDSMTDVGFFNHWYHEGRWSWATTAAPTDGQLANELYMTTTDAPGSGDPAEQNPLYAGVQGQCKGLLLVGCRTLLFLACRQALHFRFPNAVIIGFVSSNAGNSVPLMQRIFRVTGRAFWSDPRRIAPEDLVVRVNTPARRDEYDRIGILVDGTLHFPAVTGRQVEAASIPHDSPMPGITANGCAFVP